MVVTDNAEMAERIKMLRNYGQKEKYQHVLPAYNRRLDTLQAAVLRVKLRHLDEWNESRQRAAQFYDELLGDFALVKTPFSAEESSHVYHLYVIEHPIDVRKP